MKVSIHTLQENPDNPRSISGEKFEKLVNSIRQFPEMMEARPIVVDQNNVILGGNMRFKAAKEAGLQEVDVYVASWDEAKNPEFIIKDNVGFGEWDWDMLANEWDAVLLDDWGLDVWQEEEEKEGLTDPDEVPEVPADPVTQLGDLWILGEHRLLCGEIVLGGYGGWVVWSFRMDSGNGMSYKMKYFHGSGGGGPVTKGVIQNQRAMASVHGADCYWSGHVHESYTMTHMCESLSGNHRPILKEVLHVRTPTYKEEYGDGTKGWHVMRGAPPKPLGCYVLDLELKTKKVRARAMPL